MRVIQILFLLVISAVMAVGAESAVVRFRAVSCLGAVPTEMYYKSKDNQYELIITYPESRSPFYNIYYSSQAIGLYQKTNDPKAGKDGYNQIGTVDIKGKGHTPLLLFLPDKNAPLGITARAMRDDADSVPAGSYHFVNLTTRPILVAMNKSGLSIPPGGDVITPPPNDNKNINVVMGVSYEGSTKLLYTNVWGREDKITTLVLIYANPEANNAFCASRIIDYPSTWKPQSK